MGDSHLLNGFWESRTAPQSRRSTRTIWASLEFSRLELTPAPHSTNERRSDIQQERHLSRKTGRRAAASMLRRAAPIPCQYQVGDMVSYRREARTGETNQTQWSCACKVIGFDGRVVWLTCEGFPIAAALDRLRPATSSEILAYMYLNGQSLDVDPTP